jgi:hypothetical protein
LLAAIFLMAGDGHCIHNNFIHHCQYNGLGNGICHDQAFSLVECNVFNWNRCPIAGTGVPESGYEARNNVQLETGLIFHFEMHGGEARGDGTDIAAKDSSQHLPGSDSGNFDPRRAQVGRGGSQQLVQPTNARH